MRAVFSANISTAIKATTGLDNMPGPSMWGITPTQTFPAHKNKEGGPKFPPDA